MEMRRTPSRRTLSSMAALGRSGRSSGRCARLGLARLGSEGGVRFVGFARPLCMNPFDPFDALMLVGRELRFAHTIGMRQSAHLRLPGAIRRALWNVGMLRARIDVELADYVRHTDGVIRHDLESLAVALGKGVAYAENAASVEMLRTLECFLVESLWAADAQLGVIFNPEPPKAV
jgi:hypothetical protein